MRRPGVWPLAVALASLAAPASGCGSSSNSETFVINERVGSVDGVRINGPVSLVRDKFGDSCHRPYQVAPCDFDEGSITGFHSMRGGRVIHNYAKVGVMTEGDEVKAILVADPNGQTLKGVSVGYPLSFAKGRYPGMRCQRMQFEDSTGNEYCVDTLPGGEKLIFGGDPIDSITIGTGIN